MAITLLNTSKVIRSSNSTTSFNASITTPSTNSVLLIASMAYSGTFGSGNSMTWSGTGVTGIDTQANANVDSGYAYETGYLVVGATPPTSITIKSGTASYYDVIVLEFGGVDLVSPIDVHAMNNMTTRSGGVSDSVTFTPANPNGMLVGLSYDQASVPFSSMTAGSLTLTTDNKQNSTGAMSIGLGYSIYPGTSSITIASSYAASRTFATAGVILKAAGSTTVSLTSTASTSIQATTSKTTAGLGSILKSVAKNTDALGSVKATTQIATNALSSVKKAVNQNTTALTSIFRTTTKNSDALTQLVGAIQLDTDADTQLLATQRLLANALTVIEFPFPTVTTTALTSILRNQFLSTLALGSVKATTQLTALGSGSVLATTSKTTTALTTVVKTSFQNTDALTTVFADGALTSLGSGSIKATTSLPTDGAGSVLKSTTTTTTAGGSIMKTTTITSPALTSVLRNILKTTNAATSLVKLVPMQVDAATVIKGPRPFVNRVGIIPGTTINPFNRTW